MVLPFLQAITGNSRPLFILILFSCIWTITPVQANTFTVTNNNDNGAGSLRDAMTTANSTPGKDTIVFNIPGSSVAARTINLNYATALPTITDPVIIDGTTQPNGTPFGKSDAMIRIPNPGGNIRGLVIRADNVEIYGITIQDYWLEGIHAWRVDSLTIGGPGKGNLISYNWEGGMMLGHVSNVTIQGNFIGLDTTGKQDLGNWDDTSGTDIYGGIGVLYSGNHNITIGGPTKAHRNFISHNWADGIHCRADTVDIRGNWIGQPLDTIDPTDQYGENWGDGIDIIGHEIQIGGSTPGERNIIVSNWNDAIEIGGRDAQISGNYLGVDSTGGSTPDNDNWGNGVKIDTNAHDILVGGSQPGEANVIAMNWDNGVRIYGYRNQVIGNKIGTDTSGLQDNAGNQQYHGVYILNGASQNYVYDNTIAYNGGAAVLIDGGNSDSNQVSENRMFCNASFNNGIQHQSGGNNSHPSPTITTADSSVVSGTATAKDTVELFMKDTVCQNCEGHIFMGNAVADNAGNWSIPGPPFPQGEYLVSGTDTVGNTSEFTNCQFISNTGPDSCAIAADFSYTQDSCASSDTIRFSDESVFTFGSGPINEWKWAFGDGDSSFVEGPKHLYDQYDPYDVTLVVSALNCTDTVTKQVDSQNLRPRVDASIEDESCPGACDGSISLSINTGYAPLDITWNSGDTTLTVDSLCSGDYDYSGTANNCPVSGSLTVASENTAEASFTHDPKEGYGEVDVDFTNTSNGGPYSWEFGDGGGSTTESPSYTYTDTGVYKVILVAGSSPCSDTADGLVTVLPSEVLVPNVFTPNNDGQNDTFAPKLQGAKGVQGRIYNRWGQLLFEWDEVNGSWDGRTSAGNEAPEGTYYFTLNVDWHEGAKGGKEEYTGTVTLLRSTD